MLRQGNAREISLLVERWRNALAAALAEAGLTVVEYQCGRVDPAACGNVTAWWSRRDAARGDSGVAFGFGPAALDVIAELAQAAGAGDDFLERILERASVLAGGASSAAECAMASSSVPPDGILHMARFRFDNGRHFDVVLACAAGMDGPSWLQAHPHAVTPDRMGILLKVAVPVTILLGKANLPLKEALKLTRGSVVDLDLTFNDPVEVVVNDRVVARGDIVVVEEKYAVRIREVYRDASSQVWPVAGTQPCA